MRNDEFGELIDPGQAARKVATSRRELRATPVRGSGATRRKPSAAAAASAKADRLDQATEALATDAAESPIFVLEVPQTEGAPVAPSPSRRSLRRVPVAMGSLVALTATSLVVGIQVAGAKEDGTMHLAPGHSRLVDVSHKLSSGTVSTTFSAPVQPQGGGLYLGLYGRVVGNNAYLAKTRVLSDGSIRVAVVRRENGVERSLKTVNIPARYVAGTGLKLELGIDGTSPATLKARAWLDGTAAPEWQVQAVDATSPMSAASGSVQVWGYSSASGTTEDVAFKGLVVTGEGDMSTALGAAPSNVANNLAAGQGAMRPSPVESIAAGTAPISQASTQPTPSGVGASPQASAAIGMKSIKPAAPQPAIATPEPAPPAEPAPEPAAPAVAAAGAAAAGSANESNTGVPAGKSLKAHRGDLVITQAGTRIDGYDVYGSIVVQAANVTIRNTKVRGTQGSGKGLIHNPNGYANLLIEDSTLIPDAPTVSSYGIKGSNFTARRINVAKCVDSIQIFGDNVSIENSWLHDHISYASDPYQGGGKSHGDAIQILKGTNIKVSGNTIIGGNNAAMMVTQDQGVTTRLSITNNYFDGGYCTVRFNDKRLTSMGGITLGDNKFGRNQGYGGCGRLRTSATSINAWNNVYTDGSAVFDRVDG